LFLFNQDFKAINMQSTNAITQKVLKAREAIHGIHRNVIENRKRRLAANRSAQPKTTPIKFTTGDFVLIASAKGKITENKLLCTWIGPFQVVACPRPYVFEVKNLTTAAPHTRLVHASRMKFYADASLQITEPLLTSVNAQTNRYEIESIVDHRTKNDIIELLIRWVGFEDDECTWEPLSHIAHDAPALTTAYLAALPASESDIRIKAGVQLNRGGLCSGRRHKSGVTKASSQPPCI
jgi:hypothetical protein